MAIHLMWTTTHLSPECLGTNVTWEAAGVRPIEWFLGPKLSDRLGLKDGILESTLGARSKKYIFP